MTTKFQIRLWSLMVILFAGLSLSILLLPMQSASAEAGTNWIGQFYNNTTLTDPPVVNNASYPVGLNFNWAAQPTDGAGATLTAVSADGWSARYVTAVDIAAGSWDFIMTGDDGYRLYIDGQLIIDEFANVGTKSTTATVPLTGGRYNLVVEHADQTGNAVIRLDWFPSDTIGGETPTPVPVAEGQVVTVNGLAVRTGPYKGASLINVARQGKTYPITAKNTREGIYTWYRITINETQAGWVSGRYFQLNEGLLIDSIPDGDSVFVSLGSPPDIGVTGGTRSVMNLRVLPSERTQLLTQLPWGAEVSIIGRTVQGFRDHWYMVRYEDQVGWIYAPYVAVRGNIADVPVH